jgi:hypothetical protein
MFKTTSNYGMEFYQLLSSSSNDVIDTCLAFEPSVAATCQDRKLPLRVALKGMADAIYCERVQFQHLALSVV